jgi:dTMP kinase
VNKIIAFAVGETRPDLTLLLHVPLAVSEARRVTRQALEGKVRDRMEEADRAFFERVEAGFQAIATQEPGRVRVIDSTGTLDEVAGRIWEAVARLV